MRDSPGPGARTTLVILSCVLPMVFSACAPAAKPLGGQVQAEVEAGLASGHSTFDHGLFGQVLSAYVDADGLVDYAGMRQDPAPLQAYLSSLEQLDLAELSRNELLALLINAYNAYTLQLILQADADLESIKDLDRPWDQPLCRIGGHTLSLNEIEHGLLRPLFRDPRVHFAVNCASLGCPRLRQQPFVGATVEAQLDQAVRDALSDDRYLKIQPDQIKVTQILEWYRDDFSDLPGFLIQHAGARAEAVRSRSAKLGFLDYDWSLNRRGASIPLDSR